MDPTLPRKLPFRLPIYRQGGVAAKIISNNSKSKKKRVASFASSCVFQFAAFADMCVYDLIRQRITFNYKVTMLFLVVTFTY